MKISREDVLHVAALAHLEITETELDALRGQLDSILTYIDKLNELDVSSVEPMAQFLHSAASPGAEWRDDVIEKSDVGVEVLKRAPEAEPPYFRVPKVIER